jgi:antitoxin (DNA-binding transcriptional repressor) of toxin-antitoxin stability system
VIIADVNEVASDLGAYLQKVEHGEPVVIAVHSHPVAELRRTGTLAVAPRPFGLCAGEFVVPDDFDSPLPEDILGDFVARPNANGVLLRLAT